MYTAAPTTVALGPTAATLSHTHRPPGEAHLRLQQRDARANRGTRTPGGRRRWRRMGQVAARAGAHQARTARTRTPTQTQLPGLPTPVGRRTGTSSGRRTRADEASADAPGAPRGAAPAPREGSAARGWWVGRAAGLWVAGRRGVEVQGTQARPRRWTIRHGRKRGYARGARGRGRIAGGGSPGAPELQVGVSLPGSSQNPAAQAGW